MITTNNFVWSEEALATAICGKRIKPTIKISEKVLALLIIHEPDNITEFVVKILNREKDGHHDHLGDDEEIINAYLVYKTIYDNGFERCRSLF